MDVLCIYNYFQCFEQVLSSEKSIFIFSKQYQRTYIFFLYGNKDDVPSFQQFLNHQCKISILLFPGKHSPIRNTFWCGMSKGHVLGIYLYQINFSAIKWQIINIQLKRMEQHNDQKKYSKISPALKSYFLHSLYFKCMTIKDAASRCKLNYSTAKVIIRDLSMKERKFVKKIIKMKENQLKKGRLEAQRECCYRDIIEKEEINKDQSQSPCTAPLRNTFSIQVVCRTAYDFFARDEKSNQE